MSNVTEYPGRNTEFFVVLGGIQTGPIRGLVELFRHNISPDTPVWYEGLSDWKPAMMCPLTRQLFEPRSEFYRAHPEALTIMQGRMNGADPCDMPDLVPDEPSDKVDTPEQVPLPAPEVPHVIPEIPDTPNETPGNSPRITYVSSTPDPKPTKRPSAYLAWSLVMTILCCLPAGIVAIIFSCRVTSKWAAGDFEGAQRASERAQLWIVLSFILGLISSVAIMLWSPFGVI